MDEDLKKALADLGVNTVAEAGKKVNEAIEAYRKESETNDKQRDAVNDEKLAKINAELDKFEKVNEVVTRLEAQAKADAEDAQKRIDELEARLNRPGAGGDAEDAEKKAYHDAFFAWARKDKDAFSGDRQNVLQVSDDTSAGYLAPAEFVHEILKDIVEISPMRSLVRVRTTGNRAIQMPRLTGRPAATWVGEIEQRPTTGMEYGLDDIPVHEANVRIPVSLQMLEDSEFNLEDEMREGVLEAFGVQEGAAIVSGNAHKKPQGLLNGEGYVRVASGLAADITADNLIDLKYAIKTGYARNGSYILNRSTLGKVRKMKDGSGQYLWTPGLADGRPNTIDGDPYTETPDMPIVGAGNKPVGYGDWRRAYTLVDRLDVAVLRDPYTASEFGQVIFNWRRRLGGAVRLGEAYALLEVAAA